MRKWQYPTAAAKKITNTLSVNGVSGTYTILGGPGVSYDWANMPFNPANEASLTTAQRNAIGTLLYDIGVAAEMIYKTSSSATSTSRMFEQFTETFGYSNAAIVGNQSGTGLTLEQFTQAILPSLDAGMPVMVGIGGANTSHSVLCDGYGYQDGDLYIHINMGYDDKSRNTWYKFPTATLNCPWIRRSVRRRPSGRAARSLPPPTSRMPRTGPAPRFPARRSRMRFPAG